MAAFTLVAAASVAMPSWIVKGYNPSGVPEAIEQGLFSNCTSASSGAAFSCEAYAEVLVPFQVAAAGAILQVIFAAVATLLAIYFVFVNSDSLRAALWSALLCLLASLFGMVAMIAMAGDSEYVQPLVWKASEPWTWGDAYRMNLGAWVALMVLSVIQLIVWQMKKDDLAEQEMERKTVEAREAARRRHEAAAAADHADP